MAERTIIVSGGDATYFLAIDELHRPIIDATGDEPPAFTVNDAALMSEQANISRASGAIGTPDREFRNLHHSVLQKQPRLAASAWRSRP
jgi:hypothetical protein